MNGEEKGKHPFPEIEIILLTDLPTTIEPLKSKENPHILSTFLKLLILIHRQLINMIQFNINILQRIREKWEKFIENLEHLLQVTMILVQESNSTTTNTTNIKILTRLNNQSLNYTHTRIQPLIKILIRILIKQESQSILSKNPPTKITKETQTFLPQDTWPSSPT